VGGPRLTREGFTPDSPRARFCEDDL
jgi:hypothetical protein